MRRAAVIAASLLAVPSSAMALDATTSIRAPDPATGFYHRITEAHVAFTLPDSWTPTHGELGNTPTVGEYRLSQPVAPSGICNAYVNSAGYVLRRAPRLDANHRIRIPYSVVDVRRTGRRGAVRWYAGAGQFDDDRYAVVAVLPQPAGPKVTVVRFALRIEATHVTPLGGPGVAIGPPSDQERKACAALARTVQATVRGAAAGARQAPGIAVPM
jgi:hypothetical protein